MRARQTGFTLIEILTVVAIIGILAAVAYPSYSEYLVRGRVLEGTSSLADMRVRLEQYYQDNRNYGVGVCGSPDNGTTRRVDVDGTVSKYFSYACTLGAGGQSYTMTASSKASTSGGANGDWTYTINNLNQRATTKYKGATSTAACWQTKQSETCS
jgi:type IV pilus assembly protein PilE